MKQEDEFTWEVAPYRDKFGRVIEADELECLLRNNEYRIVAQDTLGKYLISTVWLGVPYDMGASYFETMVFDMSKATGSGEKIISMFRYYNVMEAEKGHQEVLDQWTKKITAQNAFQSTDQSTHDDTAKK